MGCNGGWYLNAWQYLKNNKQGITLESLYPYTGRDEDCKSFVPYYYIGYTAWVSQSADGLKNALQYYPIAVAIEGENDSFRNHKGGIITQGCGTHIDHAVMAVGYGKDSSGQEYIIIKNSWGTWWGESGYARIAPNQCGITYYPAMAHLR